MDSHIVGPRSIAQGAIVSAICKRVAYTDAAQTGKELFRTVGVTTTNPCFIRATTKVNTAFNASGVVAKIVMTDPDGSNSTDVITLGTLAAILMLTSNKIFKLVYTVGTGGSAGEAGFILEAFGAGYPLP